MGAISYWFLLKLIATTTTTRRIVDSCTGITQSATLWVEEMNRPRETLRCGRSRWREYCHKLVGMTGFEGLASFDIYWRLVTAYFDLDCRGGYGMPV